MLRQRAGPLHLAPFNQVRDPRAENAEDIDSPVALKMPVLDGDDGVPERRRDLVVVDDHPALERKTANERPIVRVKLRHHVRAVVLQQAHLREIRRVHKDQPAQRAGARRQQEQD